jgi:acyl-CoA synthetase (AMP-forming)/AMP-acid ligase II
MDTVYQLIHLQSESQPEEIALLSPGHEPLSYGNLLQNVELIARSISGAGIRPTDRVAIVLPGGAETALAFLSVSCAATSAPLNPLYQKSEFEYYLTDLEARALLTLKNHDSPARKVAASLSIPIFELIPPLDNKSIWLNIESDHIEPYPVPIAISEENVALVLHTSGTTSKPKQVQLSHRNLSISARHVSSWLSLSKNDRCLNIMPLFHIHGIIAALLASISAGGSVVCPASFNAPKFFEWVDEYKPTWYTAVPTMHSAILSRAKENQAVIQRNQLRFIRSSSSPLPPQLMNGLESTFKAPVIEAYGMTEAAHQMTSNPMPPLQRKAGSVGLPAGPNVAILQEDGNGFCEPGKLGEIVIQGPNVTGGYFANPEANRKAFTEGWFRTGDQGYFDQEGYLYITGRLKEMINRGGEKISPREVEEVLLDHPAVAQAVVFAMPDQQLGEEVAAAVVLREVGITEQSLRQFISQKLSIFKVPKRILFLDEIPKGATGKVQRIGMAARLGIRPGMQAEEESPNGIIFRPRNQFEETLQNLWQEVLKLPQVGVNQNFLEVGGDSILATLLFSRVQEEFIVDLTLLDFFDAKSIADQAVLIQKNLEH